MQCLSSDLPSLLLLFACLNGTTLPTIAAHNASNVESLYCFDNTEWTGPLWPRSTFRAYRNIMKRLDAAFPTLGLSTIFEYLLEFETPASDWPLIYTPFKIERRILQIPIEICIPTRGSSPKIRKLERGAWGDRH